jgi:hypothetical protein
MYNLDNEESLHIVKENFVKISVQIDYIKV